MSVYEGLLRAKRLVAGVSVIYIRGFGSRSGTRRTHERERSTLDRYSPAF